MTLYLTNGNTIQYQVPQDRVDEIVSRPNWDWPEGMPEEAKPFAGVFSDLALRVQKAAGFLQAGSLDGRTWLVRADAIVAFSVKDYRAPESPRPIGFELPVGQT